MAEHATDALVRCWQEGPEWDERTHLTCPDCDGQHGTTCLLPEGHLPPHNYVPDCSVSVKFAEESRGD